jgi:hypothetical protein
MKLLRTIRYCVIALAFVLPSVQARAQATGPIGPIGSRQLPVPAARGIGIEPSPLDSSRPQADTHTLSSIERLGTGSLEAVTSFVDPSFRFNQSMDTGVIPGTSNKTSVTSMGMSLAFDNNTGRSHLIGTYSGAHLLYRPDRGNDTTNYNLSLSEELRWARWTLRLREDLQISPEAAFGGLDTGGVSAQVAAGMADTILTQRAKRVNNGAAAEINYYLSRRSVLTVAGAYNLLHFNEAGYINNQSVTGRIGYDYALSPKNTVGLLYNYTRTAYSANNPLLQADTAQLAFGRKITGRLAFQISAGPQLLRSAGSSRILGWNMNTATTYQTRHIEYSLSYAHGTATGSGVFSGTHNDTVAVGMNYSLTPSWTGTVNGGYAFNKALLPVPGYASSFGNWYGTANLGRTLGRHFRFLVNYGYQQQNGAGGICPVAACGGVTPSRHIVGGTLEWHPFSMVAR